MSPLKYAAVWRVSWRDEWAYRLQVLWNSLFLVVILYIFSQLWVTTFHSAKSTHLNGFTAHSMLWYLTITEAIIIGTPRVVQTMSQEVIEGGIAYRLTKPIRYLGYQGAVFLAQAAARMLLNLVIGGGVALVFAGVPPFTLTSILAGIGALCLSVALSFSIYTSVGLLAFWVEDARGIELIVSRFVMILGGMMIPIPFFPAWLARLCRWLPFQAIAYLPARALTSHAIVSIVPLFGLGFGWLLVVSGVMVLLYRVGVKRVYVQGG